MIINKYFSYIDIVDDGCADFSFKKCLSCYVSVHILMIKI
jgi:hypothetical protein